MYEYSSFIHTHERENLNFHSHLHPLYPITHKERKKNILKQLYRNSIIIVMMQMYSCLLTKHFVNISTQYFNFIRY